MIAIVVSKSLIDFKMKIADRLWDQNRWSIFVRESRSNFAFCLYLWSWNCFFNRWSIWKRKTLIDFDLKIADRFPDQNRSPIFPERFSIAIMIAIAVLKSGSGCEMMLENKYEPVWFTLRPWKPSSNYFNRLDPPRGRPV